MSTSLLHTLQSKGFFTYGKILPGLTIYGKPAPYPVLNERAVRAGAGIMFVMGFFSFMQALYSGVYEYLAFTVLFFFVDFVMKVIIGTRFSPISIVAN